MIVSGTLLNAEKKGNENTQQDKNIQRNFTTFVNAQVLNLQIYFNVQLVSQWRKILFPKSF